MLFINTRPDERAVELTQALQDAGYLVESLPLLELVAQPFNQPLFELYQQLVQTQMIVVVSPTAADIGMRYLQQSGMQLSDLQHIQWIAVGQATANTLAEYGITAHIPQVESSEGMLSLPVLQQLQNIHCVAFWRGEGGRQFMMQALQENGVQVLNFILYDRQCPEATQLKFRQLRQHADYAEQKWLVLITSEASWKNWLALWSSGQLIQADCDYFVLGTRLFHLVEAYRCQHQAAFHIIQLENLSPSGMIHHIQTL